MTACANPCLRVRERVPDAALQEDCVAWSLSDARCAAHPLFVQRFPTLRYEHDRTVAVSERPGRIKNFHCPATQRHPVLTPCLHPSSGSYIAGASKEENHDEDQHGQHRAPHQSFTFHKQWLISMIAGSRNKLPYDKHSRLLMAWLSTEVDLRFDGGLPISTQILVLEQRGKINLLSSGVSLRRELRRRLCEALEQTFKLGQAFIQRGNIPPHSPLSGNDDACESTTEIGPPGFRLGSSQGSTP